jgi:hypothetical protein
MAYLQGVEYRDVVDVDAFDVGAREEYDSGEGGRRAGLFGRELYWKLPVAGATTCLHFYHWQQQKMYDELFASKSRLNIVRSKMDSSSQLRFFPSLVAINFKLPCSLQAITASMLSFQAVSRS